MLHETLLWNYMKIANQKALNNLVARKVLEQGWLFSPGASETLELHKSAPFPDAEINVKSSSLNSKISVLRFLIFSSIFSDVALNVPDRFSEVKEIFL